MPPRPYSFPREPSCIRLIRVYLLVTNICDFDCVVIGLVRTTSRLTKLFFQTTLLQRLTKICRRPFSTVCLLLKVAGPVETCMFSISLLMQFFPYGRKTHFSYSAVMRAVVSSFSWKNCDSLSNFISICWATRGMFRMGVATSLEFIRYSEEGHLAGNFMWGVAMIFSPIWTPNSWNFFSIA